MKPWITLEMDDLLPILQKYDTSEFIEHLNKQLDYQTPLKELSDLLLGIQKGLYWKHQNIEKVLLLSEKIMEFLESHPDASARHKSPVLYNIASFTCPWWSDSLDISVKQGKIGLQAAIELVELRKKYNFEPIKMSGGLWILAGHYLYTAKDYQKAFSTYTQSEKLAAGVPSEKMSPLLVSNSIEGQARTEFLLGDSLKGEELMEKAMQLYNKSEDEYSKGEADIFLKLVNSL